MFSLSLDVYIMNQTKEKVWMEKAFDSQSTIFDTNAILVMLIFSNIKGIR